MFLDDTTGHICHWNLTSLKHVIKQKKEIFFKKFRGDTQYYLEKENIFGLKDDNESAVKEKSMSK